MKLRYNLLLILSLNLSATEYFKSSRHYTPNLQEQNKVKIIELVEDDIKMLEITRASLKQKINGFTDNGFSKADQEMHIRNLQAQLAALEETILVYKEYIKQLNGYESDPNETY